MNFSKPGCVFPSVHQGVDYLALHVNHNLHVIRVAPSKSSSKNDNKITDLSVLFYTCTYILHLSLHVFSVYMYIMIHVHSTHIHTLLMINYKHMCYI